MKIVPVLPNNNPVVCSSPFFLSAQCIECFSGNTFYLEVTDWNPCDIHTQRINDHDIFLLILTKCSSYKKENIHLRQQKPGRLE